MNLAQLRGVARYSTRRAEQSLLLSKMVTTKDSRAERYLT